MDFEKLDKSQKKIIASLDFGTTFSGLAWAEVRDPGRVTCITRWPGSEHNPESETREKCPTKLNYSVSGREWGFAIDPFITDSEKIAWFKLDMDPENQLEYRLNSGDGARGELTPEMLTADYIESISDHFMYMLKQQVGAITIKNTPIEWVITVPAIWSDEGKEKTREAALKAPAIKGRHIHLVSEPEAAALYTLQAMDRHCLKTGDTFITVDAGGGTVDLISYTIKKLSPVLEVDEAAPGDGGLCGSNFLDDRFERRFREKVSHLDGFTDDLVTEARESFERSVKPAVSTTVSPNFEYRISAGGLASNKEARVSAGKFYMRASEVWEIFEPVVDKIIELVQKQIRISRGKNNKVKSLLLVGDFGASRYLRVRLEEAIDSDIELMQPPDAWTAVVRGAVLKGLAINSPEVSAVAVQKRRARKSYGFELNVCFDADKHSHLERTKFFSEEYGEYRVKVMQWFVKRGQEVSEEKPIPIQFSASRAVSRGHAQHLNQIIYCDFAERDLLTNPTDILKDQHIRLLGELKADISEIPDDEHKQEMGRDLEMYYIYDIEVRARFGSASTEYTLWYDNEKRGTVSLEYA